MLRTNRKYGIMLIVCVTDVLQAYDKTFIKSTFDVGIVLIRHVERSETQSKHLAEASLAAVVACRIGIVAGERYPSGGFFDFAQNDIMCKMTFNRNCLMKLSLALNVTSVNNFKVK